jgi:4-carboxymuconolactone decarboxylase
MLLDPAERSRRGAAQQSEVLAAKQQTPTTLFEASWRDFIFAEVWTRPGLDRRARFLISLCTAACAGDTGAVETYARGALTLGELTLAELREAALHLAVYGGWSEATLFDAAVTRAAAILGLPAADCPPIRADPWDPKTRHEEGCAAFKTVMTFGGPRPETAYFEAGIVNFVFGEVWMRPGLDQRARRWITLACVGYSSADTPIRSHVYSAMSSGNAARDEMFEFVLQFAIHAGWPKGSVMQSAVIDMADRIEKGLKFEAR